MGLCIWLFVVLFLKAYSGITKFEVAYVSNKTNEIKRINVLKILIISENISDID